MSKKKFKAGLESLFGDTGGEDQLPGIRPLLVEEEPAKEKSNVARDKRPKRRSSKNFTSDLEGLFHNALDKEYQEKVKKSSPLTKGRDTRVKKRSERPVIGIDALIRRTSLENREEIGASTPLKKRVTFTLEKKKIEQLKSIAKMKKAYLKDIMDDIISDYLNERAEQNPPSAN
ncbi:MAG: hypothetical protein AAF960_16435 [Bacteroidota bacterium]